VIVVPFVANVIVPFVAKAESLFQLIREMDEGRRKRLAGLGFSESEAAELSALHTRNFM
jgi:hypothetical protein